MIFKNVIGQEKIKAQFVSSVESARVPHAQLFVGPEGIGLLQMAISLAKLVLKKNVIVENYGVDDSILKVDNMSHPDLHFVFPVTTNDKIKSHPVSLNFIEEWKSFLETNPFGTLMDWYNFIGIQNKQGQIGVDEALEIVKKLSLKSYEGGYKVMIIWMADKMNTATSNKILKILEEPPQKTLFILITEKIDDILPTIISRCQATTFKSPSKEEIQSYLQADLSIEESKAKKIAHLCQGSLNKALKLLNKQEEDQKFEQLFVKWVRTAFKAKGNPGAILELIDWAEELAAQGREIQKQFLSFCIDFFRQALLLNYQAKELVYLDEELENFSLDKFAPFVNDKNINEIFDEISKAIYHIERNGNGKIILTDLSIKLTRLIHKKIN